MVVRTPVNKLSAKMRKNIKIAHDLSQAMLFIERRYLAGIYGPEEYYAAMQKVIDKMRRQLSI